MISPLTMLLPAVIVSPSTPAPAPRPFSSMSGVPANPGSVVPSIVTGSVTGGSGDAGAIVWAPPPGMLKVIRSAPRWALAALIAARRVHAATVQVAAPGSSVELTTKESGGMVGVGVSVLVAVAMGTGVLVDVGVLVAVGTTVFVAVDTSTGVLVDVGVLVLVAVGVLVTVGVAVAVGVGVGNSGALNPATARMRLLPVSAMYSTPPAVIASPFGWLSPAPSPIRRHPERGDAPTVWMTPPATRRTVVRGRDKDPPLPSSVSRAGAASTNVAGRRRR